MKTLDENIQVAPQIDTALVAEAAAAGVTLIINNRPDDEEPGQPSGADIRRAAEAAGIAYVAIPVTQAGFSHVQIDAMTDALDNAGGPVLAYCRSGTRSTLLWALAKAKAGENPEHIAELAAAAGYNVAPIRPMLDALSAK